MLTDVVLLFQHFLARKVPVRELSGVFMAVVEHCDDLLAYLVESRVGTEIMGHNANSVERDLAADGTVCARFPLMVIIIKISEYSVMGFP